MDGSETQDGERGFTNSTYTGMYFKAPTPYYEPVHRVKSLLDCWIKSGEDLEVFWKMTEENSWVWFVWFHFY